MKIPLDVRGERLQLDYLKAEVMLREHAIQHTIVVFGSTRARPGSRYYAIARELGQRVARCTGVQGDGQMVVMTGGGPGIMEAANRGASETGAATVGLNIALPENQSVNPYVPPDLCVEFHYFAIRKLHLLMRARALVVFPGGYGTFDELFEVLTLVQTAKIDPLPVVLVGEEYWRRAVDFEFMLAEGMIEASDRQLFVYRETAAEILDYILAWHAQRGRPLACAAPNPA